MIRFPKIGQKVQVHYNKRIARIAPHHGQVGHVQTVSRGPGPRNICVDINGKLVVIPRGNLNATEATI